MFKVKSESLPPSQFPEITVITSSVCFCPNFIVCIYFFLYHFYGLKNGLILYIHICS